jgi:hypothetical protein
MPSPSRSPTCDSEEEYSIALMVYSVLKKKGKSKLSVTKEEKSVKTKELVFAVNNSSYIDFLQSILDKHGQAQYKASTKKWFPFKFVLPKAKK